MSDPLVCLWCGCNQLGSPDELDELRPGSPVFCGACGALHLLDVDGGDVLLARARLRKPDADERAELAERPNIKEWRAAFSAADLEARPAGVAATKAGGMKITDGDRIRLEGFGPAHPKFRPS